MISDITAEARALRTFAALRPRLVEIRQQATLACALSPVTWLAVHGVSLAQYLEKLDALEALCREAEERLNELDRSTAAAGTPARTPSTS